MMVTTWMEYSISSASIGRVIKRSFELKGGFLVKVIYEEVEDASKNSLDSAIHPTFFMSNFSFRGLRMMNE